MLSTHIQLNKASNVLLHGEHACQQQWPAPALAIPLFCNIIKQLSEIFQIAEMMLPC
jgi:hypothetical protein